MIQVEITPLDWRTLKNKRLYYIDPTLWKTLYDDLDAKNQHLKDISSELVKKNRVSDSIGLPVLSQIADIKPCIYNKVKDFIEIANAFMEENGRNANWNVENHIVKCVFRIPDLGNVLKQNGISNSDLAQRTGLSEDYISNLVSGCRGHLEGVRCISEFLKSREIKVDYDHSKEGTKAIHLKRDDDSFSIGFQDLLVKPKDVSPYIKN